MKVVTAKEMQALDRYTIEQIGIPGVVLMEKAGHQVVTNMLKYFPDLSTKRVNIVCGKGNNGGDGLVAARHLSALGAGVQIFLLAKQESLAGDAKINRQIAKNLDIPVIEILSYEDLKNHETLFLEADLFVDSIFGTGLIPPVQGIAAEVIKWLNHSGKPIVSIDIPSGLSADEAHPSGPHIKAHLTVTFALPKLAHLLPPACLSIGQLEIVDIGIPEKAMNQAKIKVEVTEARYLKDSWPKRPLDSHKGTYGHLLVLAGSVGKTGAAYLTALAAGRTGTGLVTLGIPESLNSIMEVKLTEAMTLPLPETESRTFSISAREVILEQLSRFSALAIGPGISTHHEVRELVLWLLSFAQIPIVLDADGINLLAGQAHLLKETKQPVILTPHPKELAGLLGVETSFILKDRLATVRKTASDFHCYLALKGYKTLLADPEGNVFINPTGNPGMASGGMGDVLTGIIGGLLAQGFAKDHALQAGVYIHGFLGDRTAKLKGEAGLLATDLIDQLPAAIEYLRTGMGK